MTFVYVVFLVGKVVFMGESKVLPIKILKKICWYRVELESSNDPFHEDFRSLYRLLLLFTRTSELIFWFPSKNRNFMWLFDKPLFFD